MLVKQSLLKGYIQLQTYCTVFEREMKARGNNQQQLCMMLAALREGKQVGVINI